MYSNHYDTMHLMYEITYKILEDNLLSIELLSDMMIGSYYFYHGYMHAVLVLVDMIFITILLFSWHCNLLQIIVNIVSYQEKRFFH